MKTQREIKEKLAELEKEFKMAMGILDDPETNSEVWYEVSDEYDAVGAQIEILSWVMGSNEAGE